MSTPAPAAPASPAAPAAPPAPPAGGEPKGATPAAPAPAGGDAPKPGDPPAPPAGDAAKKRKYKVEGNDVEVDLGDEKALDLLIQKGLAADKRFTEASKYRKDSEALISLLQRDPMAVMERMAKMGGKDVRKTVEDWLYRNHVELENKSPEERQRILDQRELEQRRAGDKDREEKSKAEQFEKAKEAYRGHYEKEVIAAIQEVGLPRTPRTVERMAHYILDARRAGMKLSAKDVAPLVKQDYEKEWRELVGPMNGEALSTLLGDETLKKLREHDLAKLKAQGNQPPAPPAPPQGGETGKPRQKQTWEDFKKEQDKIIPLR